jgi:signal transduction histidine kinase
MSAMAIIDEIERAELETNNSWLSISLFHDLRNPLATIYAAAEMLMDLDPEPTEVKRLVTNMYCAAGRMRKLLADLSSVASGNRSTAEICDIRDVILAASEAASAGIGNQGVEIVLDMPRKIELALMCSRLECVFFNLITNALEAMPSGGHIHIRAKTAGDCVLVEIEDTGPGIPLGIRDRLFEPFVTAGKRDGLGLGLALARQTVLDHGGDMWTESAAGARFVIRLPLNRHPRYSDVLILRGRNGCCHHSEFRGTITPDKGFSAFVKAREEYTAVTRQRQ